MRHSSFLEVRLDFLYENLKEISQKSRAEIIPMVKANAYGNGLVPVSEFLVKECGVKKLGCASLGEALEIFIKSPELKSEVLVFSDSEVSHLEHRKIYKSFNITPVLHRPEDVHAILSDSDLSNIPLVIKVNTGMNRLGLSLNDLDVLAPRLKSRGVKHLMTHFACSYYGLKDGDKTHRQMQEFKQALKILKHHEVTVEETSVSNSGAIEQGFGLDETYIRPGLMLYGPPSVEPHIWKGRQISRFVTRIIKTFFVKKGTPVGYGINVASEDGFIAIIPIGYGDGLMTYASGCEIQVKDFRAKIFARVNMDMAFLFFPTSAEKVINVGDEVEIWNHDNRVISDLANQMKTIPYQLMCGVTNRIPRIYKVK
jgi:alanine racemase